MLNSLPLYLTLSCTAKDFSSDLDHDLFPTTEVKEFVEDYADGVTPVRLIFSELVIGDANRVAETARRENKHSCSGGIMGSTLFTAAHCIEAAEDFRRPHIKLYDVNRRHLDKIHLEEFTLSTDRDLATMTWDVEVEGPCVREGERGELLWMVHWPSQTEPELSFIHYGESLPRRYRSHSYYEVPDRGVLPTNGSSGALALAENHSEEGGRWCAVGVHHGTQKEPNRGFLTQIPPQ